jgi:aspartate/methionine/tyrosine aminotransferase
MMLIEKAKVAVYPGIGFGERGEGHIRISYATSREKLEDGLTRLEKAITQL